MPQEKFLRHMRDRYNPYKGFFRDNLFDNDIDSDFLPAANISSTNDKYQIQLALPGFKKDHINISVSNNVLNVKGEEVKESELTDNFTRREFYQSSFERSFDLPQDVNEDKIEARFEDGVLKISIGRHDHDPKERTRRISID